GSYPLQPRSTLFDVVFYRNPGADARTVHPASATVRDGNCCHDLPTAARRADECDLDSLAACFDPATGGDRAPRIDQLHQVRRSAPLRLPPVAAGEAFAHWTDERGVVRFTPCTTF